MLFDLVILEYHHAATSVSWAPHQLCHVVLVKARRNVGSLLLLARVSWASRCWLCGDSSCVFGAVPLVLCVTTASVLGRQCPADDLVGLLQDELRILNGRSTVLENNWTVSASFSLWARILVIIWCDCCSYATRDGLTEQIRRLRLGGVLWWVQAAHRLKRVWCVIHLHLLKLLLLFFLLVCQLIQKAANLVVLTLRVARHCRRLHFFAVFGRAHRLVWLNSQGAWAVLLHVNIVHLWVLPLVCLVLAVRVFLKALFKHVLVLLAVPELVVSAAGVVLWVKAASLEVGTLPYLRLVYFWKGRVDLWGHLSHKVRVGVHLLACAWALPRWRVHSRTCLAWRSCCSCGAGRMHAVLGLDGLLEHLVVDGVRHRGRIAPLSLARVELLLLLRKSNLLVFEDLRLCLVCVLHTCWSLALRSRWWVSLYLHAELLCLLQVTHRLKAEALSDVGSVAFCSHRVVDHLDKLIGVANVRRALILVLCRRWVLR